MARRAPFLTFKLDGRSHEMNFGDDHMTLKLVATNDDRALAIRDHLLFAGSSGRLP
jgi:hypothetical protein